MFKKLNVLDEKDKRLRKKSDEVIFPLSEEEKKIIDQIIINLRYSQIKKYEEKYKLRPGMGMAFPQVGINKRVIVIVYEYEDGKFENYVVANPKLISHSEEMIAAEAGEGCLSVNREVDGHVKRYARIKISGFDINGNPVEYRAREELAIAFQHELDHLEGILFFDRIDKKKPFITDNSVRLI